MHTDWPRLYDLLKDSNMNLPSNTSQKTLITDKTDVQPAKETTSGFRADIMIVDDTLTNLRLLSTILSARGYRVRGMTNGETALTAVSLSPPDLILLDISMPDMDGYEVCRLLKAEEHSCQIPIIFISAMNEVLDKVRAFSVGGVDYITKPFHVEEVLMRVKTHLMLRQLQRELEQANAELRRQVTLDGLTQIANRRRFDEYLHSTLQQMVNDREPLSLVLCDIDYFKLYNDTYGHQSGDQCLCKIAQLLQKAERSSEDLAARYGGEEFALILPRTDSQAAYHVAETLRITIAKSEIEHLQSQVSPYITLSIGIATTTPTSATTPYALLKTADEALYIVKAQGRNGIVCQQF